MAVGWLFLDMNSFFASVEQQERPALRGRPVAVAPLMPDTICCIAASYRAKAHGVKTGANVTAMGAVKGMAMKALESGRA